MAGSTLTDAWGDFDEDLWCVCPDTDTAGEAIEAEALEVEEALECVWWWCGIERILEIEDDVDFLPRRPPEDLLYDPRGVNGDGDTLGRFPLPLVFIRGRAGGREAEGVTG